MRILIHSYLFHPSVGGSETATSLLAHEFARRGHQVTVTTKTPATGPDEFPFNVVRRPSPWRLLRFVRWAEVVVHSNISLRAAWALLFAFRPWVVIHHTRLTRPDGSVIWMDRFKQIATRRATNIAVSRSMADSLSAPAVILGNGYADNIFFRNPDIIRDRELIFLGRLNREKGAHVIINALALLKRRGFHARLTIIGSGTEQDTLLQLARDLGVHEQVLFLGRKTGIELARLLNEHRFIIIPSLVAETFGIVALEGMACGCVPIASDVGALRESIGPCGVTFPRGDPGALADRVVQLLTSPDEVARFQATAPEHLAHFTRSRIADEYLAVIEKAACGRTPTATPSHHA